MPGHGPHLPRRSAGCHAGELHRPVPRSRAGGGPRSSWQPQCRGWRRGRSASAGARPSARPARSDRQAQIRTGERLLLPLYHQGRPLPLHQPCVGCGKCAAVCVENNIRLRDGRPVWGDRCTHCMACICGCPAGAIEYGRASRGKPRYQCPEYEK